IWLLLRMSGEARVFFLLLSAFYILQIKAFVCFSFDLPLSRQPFQDKRLIPGNRPERSCSRSCACPCRAAGLFLNDTERLARVRPGDTVGALKRAYFPGQEQQVRLIYQGQLLRDDAQSLAALHLTHNSVLHCHISPHSPAPAPAGPHASADPVHAALNVGSLMLPLFVLMLAVLWYFQLQYRHVFTATATTFLAGLTLLFSFMAFTMYRR
uniref:Transmembrane and ubiquitin-like domain-containing protein 1 n=1 Tax=Dromaius novaehollandiae TaxID=8790 RepID=A0A8C4JU38_DRONO